MQPIPEGLYLPRPSRNVAKGGLTVPIAWMGAGIGFQAQSKGSLSAGDPR